ncbi:MAG: diacylglycerol kinase family protein [Candidatus Falkowbacteria bacterium]|nr:diacylglycerol kinase family protein [Candidatus Falkowbacteria bacterium]
MNNIYVYDQELSGRRYQKLLEQLETRLTDLGIGGKIYRLGPMTRLEDMARDELARHPKTLVAVGGDILISRLAALMTGSKTPLGVIPIGKSMIADAFGINLESACRILAARRIVDLDVGQIDKRQSFVCRAVIEANNPELVLDNELNVSASGRVIIEVVNVMGDEYGYRGSQPKADDGRLNVYILKTESGILKKDISQSAFVCRHLLIKSGLIKIEVDGGIAVSGAKEIEVVPKIFSAIVSKDRRF